MWENVSKARFRCPITGASSQIQIFSPDNSQKEGQTAKTQIGNNNLHETVLFHKIAIRKIYYNYLLVYTIVKRQLSALSHMNIHF